jgi:hypothetical protein
MKKSSSCRRRKDDEINRINCSCALRCLLQSMKLGETTKEEKRREREQKEEGKIISDRWWWMRKKEREKTRKGERNSRLS